MYGSGTANSQMGMQPQQQQQAQFGAFGSIQPQSNPVNNLFGGFDGSTGGQPAAAAAPMQPTMGQLQPTQLAPQPVMQGQAGASNAYSSFKSIFGGLGAQPAPVVAEEKPETAGESSAAPVGADFGSFGGGDAPQMGGQTAGSFQAGSMTGSQVGGAGGVGKQAGSQFGDFGSFSSSQAPAVTQQGQGGGGAAFDFGQFGAPDAGGAGGLGGGMPAPSTVDLSVSGGGGAMVGGQPGAAGGWGGAGGAGGSAAAPVAPNAGGSFDFGSFGSPTAPSGGAGSTLAPAGVQSFGSFGGPAPSPTPAAVPAAAGGFGSFESLTPSLAKEGGLLSTAASAGSAAPAQAGGSIGMQNTTSEAAGGGGAGNSFDFGSFGVPGGTSGGNAPATGTSADAFGAPSSGGSAMGGAGDLGSSLITPSAPGGSVGGPVGGPVRGAAPSTGSFGMTGTAVGMGSFGGGMPVQRSMEYQFADLASVGAGSGLAGLSSRKAATSVADASHEELKVLFRSLLSAQRFQDAADCRLFSQLRREIAVKRPLWEQAKASQDFVASLELREAVESMEKQMEELKAKSHGWRGAPGGDHVTLSDLAKRIEQEAGKQKANEFTAMYSTRFSSALQKGDLPNLIDLLGQAKATAELLRKAEPVIGTAQVTMWRSVLQKCVDELKLAVDHLAGIEKELRQGGQAGTEEATKLLSAPKTVAYIRGLVEMRRLAKRVQLALMYYGPSQAVDVEDLKKLSYEAEGSWASVGRLLQALRLPQDTSSQEAKADFSKQTFAAGVCAVCMLPGVLHQPAAGLPDLVPTLKWSGSLYHAPCANFYCNLISATPPPRG